MPDKPKTVEEYISSKPKKAQERLGELRRYLKLADPNADEELKWGKPAFVNNGILYVYAVFTKHISLHPTPSVIKALRKELESFKLSDNTIHFPLEDPIPKELVTKIANLRVFEKNNKGIGWK
ncbi:DUF1801 domain-containing protein [Salinimonas sp. HHU 13199]|uniref:DUF1801 domain-containing protein n=1 Tax=Salinimonas profundi TaxID=2729140 RepID=A0ABR8LCS1_9ALTE|nr:DUF1801 domain-containing protein [Salinimonas profundi]MBD3584131.1 DUF1801 domain-containing protein [Salinimonas profundi]